MARVISATNRPLGGGTGSVVRSDLYFRLAGYTIVAPPLRERLADIALLAQSFLDRFRARYELGPCELTPPALELLKRHEWPGNVRELRVVVENAAVRAAPGSIDERIVAAILERRASESEQPEAAQGHAYAVLRPAAAGSVSLPALEREVILDAYSKHSPNLTKTAKCLGIPRSTLRDRLRKLGAI
jgi:DNA-binding NtrC family response regulator